MKKKRRKGKANRKKFNPKDLREQWDLVLIHSQLLVSLVGER
jgi:hypothetical protein